MRGRDRAGPVLAAMSTFLAAACGGDGPTDPPPAPPPPPGPIAATTVDVAPGELVTLTSPSDVRAFRLTGGETPRAYEIIVQSASIVPGLSTRGRLRVRVDRASAQVVPARAQTPAPAPGLTSRDLRRRATWLENELRLRERSMEELARVGAQPVRQPTRQRASEPAGPVAAGSPASLGDTLSFSIAVGADLHVDCNSTTTVRAVVRYAGQNFTVVEDLAFADQPAGDRFTDDEFEVIGRQLDEIVYPMDVAYFGEPADIDGNETVVALITAEVNKLTPEGEDSIVAGFFLANDLTSRSTCPASNEGEIFYLVGPDPDSDFGADISLTFANALVRTTVAHEFVHLLNTQQRVTLGNGTFRDREVVWLDEGMAHLAEEIGGLRTAGLGTRDNLDLAGVAGSEEQLEIYNHFHLLNHLRLGRFLRGGCPSPDADGPAATLALGATGGEDPGGTESLSFRGFAYGFLRWLGDHFGESGSGGALPGSREETLFRELSSGGPAHMRGVANVERAIGLIAGSELRWDELLPLYLTSLIADDNAPANTDPRAQWRTWNLRGVYGQLNDSNLGSSCPLTRPFPLSPSRVSLHAATASAIDFEMNASTGRFFSLAGTGAHPDVIVEISDPEGGDLEPRAWPQVTVLRVR